MRSGVEKIPELAPCVQGSAGQPNFALRRGIYVRGGIGGTPDAQRTEDALMFYRHIINVLPHLHKYQCCVQTKMSNYGT